MPQNIKIINLESNQYYDKPIEKALESMFEAFKHDYKVDRSCAEYNDSVKRWKLLVGDANNLNEKRASKRLFLKLREAFGTVRHQLYPDSNLSKDGPTQTLVSLIRLSSCKLRPLLMG